MKTWTIRLIAIGLILVAGFFILRGVLALRGPDPSKGDLYQERVATLEVSADRLIFHPVVDYEIAGLTLVVVGPDGFRWEGEFGGLDFPTFNTVDEAGTALPDGSYRYALQAYPVVGPEAQAAFAQAVETRDPKVVEDLQAKGLLPQGPFAQEGAFALIDGVYSAGDFEQTSELNAPVEPNFLISENLYVQGDACIGTDCVNNENLGFDTLRLKENNLRIKFDDTSTSAGFPANDWQITANDTSSGGNSYLAIEDITNSRVPFLIEAGARTNTLYVDSTSRVGIGTSTPVKDLHITNGNTPSVRLEQNGSSGFTPQTWDVAGNEANFYIQDVTNSSRLPFRIRPGAPTNSIDIRADGKIGLGTDSPDYSAEIYRNDASAFLGVTTNNAAVEITAIIGVSDNIVQVGSATATTIDIVSGGQTIASFDTDGNLILKGLLTEASDRNLKENFASVNTQDILTKIASLPITTWNFKGQDETHLGPVAQDFSAAFGLGGDNTLIAPLDVNGVALAGVQALYDQLQEKDAQIAALETRLSTLESQTGPTDQSAQQAAPWVSILAGLLGAAAFSLYQKLVSSRLTVRKLS